MAIQPKIDMIFLDFSRRLLLKTIFRKQFVWRFLGYVIWQWSYFIAPHINRTMIFLKLAIIFCLFYLVLWSAVELVSYCYQLTLVCSELYYITFSNLSLSFNMQRRYQCQCFFPLKFILITRTINHVGK